jgi:NADH-quinone oxidoreductase subunit L
MRFTWVFMWIGALALIGVPPFSGFWSKDSVLLACWESGQYAIFAVALVSVILTSFYVIRLMGMIFHSGSTAGAKAEEIEDHEDRPHHEHGEANWVMLVPYGILAVLTVAIGIAGPWIGEFITHTFEQYFVGTLGITVAAGEAAATTAALSGLGLEIVIAVASTLMVILGAIPAYRLYISHKSQPENIVDKSSGLRGIYKFLWNRWYIDAFYNKVFVNTALAIREPLKKYIENPLDWFMNRGVPEGFTKLSNALKKVQTGRLRVNMLYLLAFLAFILVLLWFGGFL